eukprot:3202519-Amphidinium_carterae.3
MGHRAIGVDEKWKVVDNWHILARRSASRREWQAWHEDEAKGKGKVKVQKGDTSATDQAAIRNPVRKWSYVDMPAQHANTRQGSPSASTAIVTAALPPPSSRFAALAPSRSAE